MILLPAGTKSCTRCGCAMPQTGEYFGYDRRNRDMLQSACRSCKRSEARAHYARNAGRLKQKSRDYYHTNRARIRARDDAYRLRNIDAIREQRYRSYREHRDRILAVAAAWRAANADLIRLRRHAYYVAHTDDIKEKVRRWRAENPERAKARNAAWRAENAEAIAARRAVYYAEHRDLALTRSRNHKARRRRASGTHSLADVRAQYARQAGRCFWCHARVGDTYHVDHVTPIALGGSNSPENIVIACPSCNLRKRANHPMDFAGVML